MRNNPIILVDPNGESWEDAWNSFSMLAPVLSDYRDYYEVKHGIDFVTGEKLSQSYRDLTAAGLLIPGILSGAELRLGSKVIDAVDDVISDTTKAVRNVNVSKFNFPEISPEKRAEIQPTLERIEKGESYPHGNDGSVFMNKEKRLPEKPLGYYKEYVHPTPEIDHAGVQRIIKGGSGETIYTPDHYQNFNNVSK